MNTNHPDTTAAFPKGRWTTADTQPAPTAAASIVPAFPETEDRRPDPGKARRLDTSLHLPPAAPAPAIVLLLVLLAWPVLVFGDTHIWSGLGGNGRWSNSGNWNSGSVPAPGEPAPVVLRFPAAAMQTFNTNDIVGLPIHELRLDRAGYILDLGDARLLGSVIMGSPFPGQSRLYGTPVLGTSVAVSIDTGLELVAFANLGDTGAGGGFTKDGGGTLTLAGNNSYKGLVRILEGWVEVTSNSGLGEQDQGVETDKSGGLVLRNVFIKGESLSLAYGGPGGSGTVTALGSNEWTGPVFVVRDASINAVTAADELILSGVLGGSEALELVGSGRVVLTGEDSNKHDGLVTVSAGELRLAKASIGSGFPDALLGSVVVGGPVGGVTAVLRHAGDHQLFDKVDVLVRATGRVEMDNHRETLRQLSFSEGGSVNSGPLGRLEIGDDLLANATAMSEAHIYGNLSLGGSTRLAVVANSIGLFIHANIEEGSAPAGLTKRGFGVLVLEGANTYSGVTTVAEGILSAASTQALGTTGAGTVVDNGASLALSGSLTIAGESLTLNGVGFAGAGALYGKALDVWSGPITLATDSRVLTPETCSLHLDGAVNGPGALQKSGPGRLFLDGTQNNSQGATLVSAGLVVLNKTNATAIPGALTISDLSTNAAVRPAGPEQIADATVVTLQPKGALEMFSGSYETIAGLAGAGQVAFDQGTLVVGALNTSSTFHGQCTGSGVTNLVKIGSGSFQFLGNTNTHTGQTTVRAGTLRMDGVQLASLILVEEFATLAGNGQCGPVQVLPRGILVPGSSPGQLTVGSIPFSPGAEMRVDLEGTTPATQHDQLVVLGGQNLNGAFLRVNYAYAGSVGDTFVILDNQTASPINGTFQGLPEGALFTTNGHAFRITYHGGTGNDVALRLEVIPGPTSIQLIDYVSGQAKLLANGTVGFTYQVEANDNLGNPAGWVNIGQAVVGGAGTMAFTDLDAGNYPHRFYRFVLP